MVWNKQIQNAKDMLDRLHKKKIWLSWGVLILDKDGYIGDSTKSELEYAKVNNKNIYYYNDDSYKLLLQDNIVLSLPNSKSVVEKK